MGSARMSGGGKRNVSGWVYGEISVKIQLSGRELIFAAEKF